MDFEQKAKKVIKENIIDFVEKVIKCPVSDLEDLIEKQTVSQYHLYQTFDAAIGSEPERKY
jgi:hypothetical protein